MPGFTVVELELMKVPEKKEGGYTGWSAAVQMEFERGL